MTRSLVRFAKIGLWGAFGLVGAVTHAGRAQTPPQADPTSIWTIQDENASVSTRQTTDRYYVNGFRLGWTSGTDDLPNALHGVGEDVWGDGVQRIAIDVTQSIFTPFNTQLKPPPRTDRPYAGILALTGSLIHDSANARSVIAVTFGVIGPPAGGEVIQNGFHDIIGQGRNKGWNYQIHAEPAFEALVERTWRVPLAQPGSLEVDVLPEVTAALGDIRIYGQVGATFRLGQGLGTDFGIARVRPGLSGSDAFTPVQPFVWYVFAGLDGQVVGYDDTLDGNAFRTSRSVPRKTLVGEIQGGVALIWHGVRLSYTHVLQTEEFSGQKAGLHQFGSLALSARF